MAQSVTLPEPIISTAGEENSNLNNDHVSLNSDHVRNIKLAKKTGLKIKRRFTKAEEKAFDQIKFEKRVSKITEPDGTVIFDMKDVEVPKNWSQLATDIIAQKYFRKAGVNGSNEKSAKEVVYRVAHSIRQFGEARGYFESEEEAENFEQELTDICITQKGAFNSPVWFNCGLALYGIKGDADNYAWDFATNSIQKIPDAYARPQCSACFIQKVDDSLMGIFELAKNEAKLFKYGSGTGSNFSRIRAKQEKLSGGGISSGLMSFLEVLDKGAGAIKSGGTTRRAAKMVTLDIDHPEIREFINWKVESEKKAKALMEAGYEGDWRGEAYRTVSGQNSNNSVRVTNEFMEKVEKGGVFHTTFRKTGEKFEEIDAQELFDEICKAAWSCADPGLQFDTTINNWHTSSNTGRINGSNPCSEYMFLDDTACNLASINLLKFLEEDGSFDIEGYRHTARILFIAQEILVDLASYPTESIAKNSHDFRPLGLGYANLGTLLMMMGIPYDSEEGRSVAASLTAIMHMHAYTVSAEMAEVMGAFEGFEKNRQPMIKVIKMHKDAAYKIDTKLCGKDLYKAACEDAENALKMGEKHGYRNAQATVLAPTGTIGLLMDCDTTGIEPEFSIVKWKKLEGGGYFKIINKSIPESLKKLNYNEEEIQEMIDFVLGHASIDHAPYINPAELKKFGFTEEQISEAKTHIENAKALDEWTPHMNPNVLESKGLNKAQIAEAKLYIEGSQTMEGAPHLKKEHLPIFDCANKCGNGIRFIAPMGHVKMLSAVQPFISGAISKTVNLPNEASVEDIKKTYLESWKLGLKAIALYRDGSKHSQPLSNKSDSKTNESAAQLPEGVLLRGQKLKMPAKRQGMTVEAIIGGQKIYLRTGEYGDGKLGEIFIDTFKEGASYRSLINCFAVAISIGLQYGVPLEKYVESFTFTRFEPSGFTNHPNIRTATSLVDFIFRVLGMEYLNRTDFVHVAPEKTQIGQNALEGKIKEAMLKEAKEAEEVTKNTSMDNYLQNMMGDAPACTTCGHITVRNASCYKCLNCGSSMGCS